MDMMAAKATPACVEATTTNVTLSGPETQSVRRKPERQKQVR